MAYIERDILDEAVSKLQKLCAKNDMICKFQGANYPFTITITPNMDMSGQIAMLDNPVGHNGEGSFWQMVFADGEMTCKIHKLTISFDTMKAIANAGIKLQEAFLSASYRESLEAKKLNKQLSIEDVSRAIPFPENEENPFEGMEE